MKNMDEIADNDSMEQTMSQVWAIFDILKKSGMYPSVMEQAEVALLLLSMYKDGVITKDFFANPTLLQEPEGEYTNIKKNDNDAYKALSQLLEFEFSKINNQVFEQLSLVLLKLKYDFLNKNFTQIFDRVIYQLSISQARLSGEFIQPVELTRFICNLAELKSDAKVYNPFAGLASFGVFLNQVNEYFGQEINQKNWAMGALRLKAYQRANEARFVCEDSILNWPDKSEKFDLIVSNPPYGIRLDNLYKQIEPGIRTSEQFLFVKGVSSLSDDGKLIALLPQVFLFRDQEQKTRQILVNEDLIDTIVSLPGGLLSGTGMPLAILFVNRKKKNPGKVRLVLAEKFVEAGQSGGKKLNDIALSRFLANAPQDEDVIKIVDNSDIKSNDYNLSVGRYFQKQIDGVNLGSILMPLPNQRVNLPKTGKFIRIRDLKDDKIDSTLDITMLQEAELKRTGIYVVSESCLLLAMRWSSLKPTYFDFNEVPVYRNQDILAFKIDDTIVDIAYLINELHADYVVKQIVSYQKGEFIPFISKDDLLKVVVKLPSLEEQKAKVINDKLTLIRLEQNLMKQLKQEFDSTVDDENSVLRHQIAGRINNLSGAIDGLIEIISSQVIRSIPDVYEYKKSAKSSLTFGKYLDILKRDISIIKDITAKDYIVKNDSGFRDFDAIKFLRDYVDELGNIAATGSVKYEIMTPSSKIFDEKSLESENIKRIVVRGDETDLKSMLDNVVDNAVKHGFRDQSFDKNKLNIICDIDKDKMLLKIRLSNSGNPLHKDFSKEDFIRNGITSDKTNGDGHGGYLINKIITNHNGHLTVSNDAKYLPGNELVTTFIVELPIKNIENK